MDDSNEMTDITGVNIEDNTTNDKWFSCANKVAIIVSIITLVVSIAATLLITNYFKDRKELKVRLTTNTGIAR